MSKDTPFQTRTPHIEGNTRIRTPQREAYEKLLMFGEEVNNGEREVCVVLPVGCGKSGCIALAPFAFKARRALVIAPNVPIAQQLFGDFDPANADMFYTKCDILRGAPYPEPVEIRGTTANIADLNESHVVITNIQQLQGEQNRWIEALSSDFFDLVLFDEGHHNVAESWESLRRKFPNARIINFSATPSRADGQLMVGRIIYSYPVARAIQEGYVKRLKAVVLNPRTLRYVRREDGEEIEVSLEEVRKLGETDADFRRSIVSSAETLNTIADASIRELEKLRRETGNKKLKIIASALNFEHCRQVVEAYTSRSQRAGYVHSREDSAANARVMKQLGNDELDVIVQVRKLGEGFDHPLLSVAAVFSIFSNLAPFIQFVGRIMRVIKHDAPEDKVNSGVVVFHAGANIARRWEDFQEYSEADQEYFDQLLPLEALEFGENEELYITPTARDLGWDEGVEVRGQTDVRLEVIPLIEEDNEAMVALKLLQSRGYTPDEVKEALEELSPVPVTKVRERQAKRAGLDIRIKTNAMKILARMKVNPEGRDLDTKHLGKSNLIVMKSAIDRQVNNFVGRNMGERSEFGRQELDTIDEHFSEIVNRAIDEVFGNEH